MGEEIYVGDIEKEVSKVDGVLNLIELRVYNLTGAGYSSTQVGQPVTDYLPTDEETESDGRAMIDLEVTDGILYNDGDTMMEIKNPNQDIRVRVKER